MTKKEYLKKRAEMMAKAEEALTAGNVELANSTMNEVKELDAKWGEVTEAQANIDALKDSAPISLENSGIQVSAGKMTVVDELGAEPKPDENKLYEDAFAKTLMGVKLSAKELEVFDAVNTKFNNEYTHDTTNTSILIPQSVVAGIWKQAEGTYPLLADVRKFNVKGTLTMKKHIGIVAGDADFYDEKTPTADEQNAFGELTLSGCELAKSITVSWKLKKMATEEFIPFIIKELGDRVGAAAGRAVAAGKGKPGESDTFKAQPLGIETALLKEVGTPQVVSFAPNASTPDPLKYEHFTKALGVIHSSYLSGVCIYAKSTTIWNEIANVKDAVGRPLFVPDVTGGGVGRVLGLVVKPDDGVSEGTILFGHANAGYAMNTAEPMSVAQEDHVKDRETDYAAYTIIDGAPVDNKAFAMIRKAPAA